MKSLKNFAFGVIALGVLLFIAAITIYILNGNIDTNSQTDDEKLSSLGSLLSGVVGTIWSLGSVLLFYLALREQKEDAKNSKEELEQTRRIYIEQSNTQKIQRFENTFFQLLNRQHKIVESMSYFTSRGKHAFHAFNVQVKFPESAITVEQKIAIYNDLFHSNQDNLTNYMRHLTLILDLIDSSNLDNPKLYADILSAQWSVYEHCLIFYKGLTSDGSKLKIHLERYSMFKDLNRGNVNSGGLAIFKEYHPNAYGYSDHSFLDTAYIPFGELNE